ncbi:MAG: hypothetical protein HY043_22505 [Verrucomicrobia bacterium]|nr:hypothetical protein [Verrucomicrobiota bacterium]
MSAKFIRGLAAFRFVLLLATCAIPSLARAQSLINVDFGAGSVSTKIGFAATGQATNDFWNRYRHYEPKFLPDMPLVANGRLEALKFADGSPSRVVITVTNAPGVWGNATGDAMFDSYIFAPNGSNLVVTLTGLDAGSYHFYFYGHAAADVSAEQNPLFTLDSGTNHLGPLTASGAAGWSAGQPWRERAQFVVFRDVSVSPGEPITIQVAPGAGGIAALNGLQILSRGTSPPRLVVTDKTPAFAGATNILFREIRYDGKLGSNDACFIVSVEAESRSTNELSALLFEGDLALLAPKLPLGWRIVNQGKRFLLLATVPGSHRLEFELAAKIQRAEPWNQIALFGPPAAIATVAVQTATPDTEIQFLSGTMIESDDSPHPTNTKPASPTIARAVLGADRQLALRWQSKTAEIARDALVTVDTKIAVQLTPAAVRFTSQFRYEILQSRISQIQFALPLAHALTRLTGEHVKDWRVTTEADRQLVSVEFIRATENATTLTLVTEQPLASLPATADLRAPQPLGVQRETGSLTVAVEDVVARIERSEGLRQVNAAPNELASFRFNARPDALQVNVARVEPVVTVADRVHARLDENRFVIRHHLSVNAARAGIYAIEFVPQTNFIVAEVLGDGVDDWKFADGKLRVSFAQRLLGDRQLVVQLEQALTNAPTELIIAPLKVANASKESAFIGASSAPGIQMKTARLESAREISINALPDRKNELLAFRADVADWRITVTTERLSARVVGEVFNLITIGDELVGGSATIRFGIVNQGVQQFRVRLPKHWRNVEFTGPGIRRKDQLDDVWTISLQDKAWSGYTLVVTYDHAFDPKQATLDASGAHPLDVERETGSVAITSAANLSVEPTPIAEPLRQIDPTELADTDRALISRRVLRAYRYEGASFALALRLTRHDEVPVLDAVADRAQLTSVLTESGEMLTQASFMVKNNERQFQRFQLPKGATLWGITVNGEPVKADQDGDWLLVSLPRGENRDQAFAVDLKYAQQLGLLGRLWPNRVALVAPKTDVPGTYAEWEVFVPLTKRAASFGGNMTVARGTTYGFRDAWREFVRVYSGLFQNHGVVLSVTIGALVFITALFVYGKKRGLGGVVAVIAGFCIVATMASMFLPALAKAKGKAVRIKSAKNLKQIGIAARLFADNHEGRLPTSFDEMMSELENEKILTDPETGERYNYVGAGKKPDGANTVVAFSPEHEGSRSVLLADGSVQFTTPSRFAHLIADDARNKDQPTASALTSREGLARVASAPTLPALAAEDTKAMSARGLNAPGAPRSTTLAAAGMSGGLGGSGGANGIIATAAPTVAGLKSLHIEIPKSGREFHFTRVLNLGGEPPTISLSLMSAKIFTAARTAFQLAAFLIGLVIVWVQWRREQPKPIWLALGATLALVAMANLYLAWRILHVALIIAMPGLALLALAGLLWKFLRRPPGAVLAPTVPTPTPPPIVGSSASATLVILIIAFSLAPGFNQVYADETVEAVSTALKTVETVSIPTPRPNTSLKRGAHENSVSIVAANFDGKARERVAQFEATFDFVSSRTNQTVTLFGGDVAVQEFAVTTGDARVWREGASVGVLLPERGAASVRMKLLVKLGGDAARRQLDFALPPALGSRVTLLLDEADADVEFSSAITFTRSAQGRQTLVEAVLGATDRLALSWTPRLKGATDVAATVFAQQTTLLTFGGGTAHTRAVLDWSVSQGELRQLRIALPEGQRLLKVSGEFLRSWDCADTNRNVLVVDLLKPISPSVRLVIETERPIEQLPADARVLLPRALDVKRETGFVAVRGVDELGVGVQRTENLERVDNAEFARAFGDEKLELFSAWRFRQPEFELTLHVETLRPKLDAIVRNHFIVGTEQADIAARVDYTISRAGIFALRLALPRDARIDGVVCDAMQTWAEHDEGTMRALEIALKQRTLGALGVEFQFSRALTNLPPTLALEGVHPLGVEKLTGFVSVAAAAGVGVKTATLAGLSEVPANRIPTAAKIEMRPALLAFKYLADEPQSVAPWKLSLATEMLESWVRAEVANFVTVSETLVSGRALVRYEIQNAPVKELRLRVPTSWRNVEITGAGIRRRDQTPNATGVEWRVELQNKVQGDYRLALHWEQPRNGTNDFSFGGVEAIGAERETGALGFFVQGQLQLLPKEASEQLLRIDARELPEWATERPAGAAILSYRYLRPGWRLAVNARHFEDAALLQALVDNVRLRTVVADDGQFMTQMELSVRNNGRQNLAITLPAGATVWSAFVDGQPVRPARSGEQLLLPLERSGVDDAPIPVELTYVAAGKFPRTGGLVDLVSPRLDVPLKDARWEVFLPPDYRYDDFKGTMNYESAGLVPIAQDFTVAEYRWQESAQRANFATQATEFFKRTKSDLARGRYDNAAQLSKFKRSELRDERAAGELKLLEQEVNRSQSSNLLQAQRRLAVENSIRLGVEVEQLREVEDRKLGEYDEKMAERQVAQLQKAQAVTVTRVTPLRVNLPTRGLRHSFVQVLQTEVDKPLTIRFSAANEREAGWLKLAMLWLGGFAVVWMLAATLINFRQRTAAGSILAGV